MGGKGYYNLKPFRAGSFEIDGAVRIKKSIKEWEYFPFKMKFTVQK